MGPRKLLREGTIMKAKSGKRLRAFLCSDVLVLTDENAKSLYRMVGSCLDDMQSGLTRSATPQPIPLPELTVKDSGSSRGE